MAGLLSQRRGLAGPSSSVSERKLQPAVDGLTVRPFPAYRPAVHCAHMVPSQAIASYTNEELEDDMARNMRSFLHVIRPDHGTPQPCGDKTERWQMVPRAFDIFVNEGTMEKDDEACYYVYQLTTKLIDTVGIVAAVSTDDFLANRVKKHEATLTHREQLFCDYLDTTSLQVEPVLLSYPHEASPGLANVIATVMRLRPHLDFSRADGSRHRMWPVPSGPHCEAIFRGFKEVPTAIISDGHHRAASVVRCWDSKRRHSDWTADCEETRAAPPSAHVMCLLVPDNKLTILGFHRLVRTEMEPDEVLAGLAAAGRVEELPAGVKGGVQQSKGMIDFLLADMKWRRLHLKEEFLTTPAGIPESDSAALTDHVLKPVLGIADIRADPRLTFVPGNPRAVTDIEEAVRDEEAGVGFMVHAMAFSELQAICEAGSVVPPKSTYILPKLLSGLVVLRYDADVLRNPRQESVSAPISPVTSPRSFGVPSCQSVPASPNTADLSVSNAAAHRRESCSLQ